MLPKLEILRPAVFFFKKNFAIYPLLYSFHRSEGRAKSAIALWVRSPPSSPCRQATQNAALTARATNCLLLSGEKPVQNAPRNAEILQPRSQTRTTPRSRDCSDPCAQIQPENAQWDPRRAGGRSFPHAVGLFCKSPRHFFERSTIPAGNKFVQAWV
jgi:hypothetical protein